MEFFRRRLTGHYANHMQLTVSIFKGVALGGGAVALMSILSSDGDNAVRLTAAVLWLASFAAVLASYEGIMMSTLVVGVPPNGWDIAAPFFMGVTEFALFAALVPVPTSFGAGSPSTAAQLRHLTWWPLVFAVESAITFAAISNSKRQVARTADGAPADVGALLAWYSEVLKRGQVATGGVTAAVVVAFIALHFGPGALAHWQAVIGVAVLLGEIGGITSQEQARHVISASVAAGRSELADGWTATTSEDR
jgi:hypothetical protein